jgi:hypothetical protein
VITVFSGGKGEGGVESQCKYRYIKARITMHKNRNTIFSACRKYRYVLWREWDMFSDSFANFICLNPGSADETQDDATVRACEEYAKRWGYGALCITSLFAFQAEDPQIMMSADDPVGPENDEWLKKSARGAGVIIAAWGTNGRYRDRHLAVIEMFRGRLFCLRQTQDGHPQHPLNLSRDLTPVKFSIAKSKS